MRKVGLLLFVAALAALAFAPSAKAIDLFPGDVTIHLQDATTLFTPDPTGSGTLIPREPNWVTPGSLTGFALDGAAPGDESRSVFNVDSFEYQTMADIILPDGQLTGLVYDLTLVAFAQIPNTTLVTLTFTGGRVAFYEDTSPEGLNEEHVFNPVATPAPLEWVADAFGPGMDGFTNVNMAPGGGVDPGTSLWLLGDFLPVNALGHTVTTLIDLSTGLGSSPGGFVDLFAGTALPLFLQGTGQTPLGAYYDLSFQFTTQQEPADYYATHTYADDGLWQVSSSDPVRAHIVPEPATLSLLGLGVVGLIARRRRRK